MKIKSSLKGRKVRGQGEEEKHQRAKKNLEIKVTKEKYRDNRHKVNRGEKRRNRGRESLVKH